MVVVILVVLWIVVLAPLYLKGRTARGSTTSIESFHHQLHLLERTGPKLVAPAYRLETAVPAIAVAAPVSTGSGLPLVSSSPRRPNLVLLRPVDDRSAEGDDIVDDGAGGHYRRVLPEPPPEPEPQWVSETPGATRPGPDPYRRQLAQRRRRHTVTALVSLMVASALLGVPHDLHAMWIVTALSGLALLAYFALLAYAQNLMVQQSVARGPRVGVATDGIYDFNCADQLGAAYDQSDRRVAASR
jgi:hypothetical protein